MNCILKEMNNNGCSPHKFVVPMTTILFLTGRVCDIQGIFLAVDFNVFTIRVFNRGVILIMESNERERAAEGREAIGSSNWGCDVCTHHLNLRIENQNFFFLKRHPLFLLILPPSINRQTYWSRRNLRVIADFPTAPSPTTTIENL